MHLDKQKFNFSLINTGENIIRCSQVDEAFFNVFNIVLNEDVAFIKPAESYIDGHPIIKIDVEYGGKLYENVKFKVVAEACAKSQVFINEHALINRQDVEFQSQALLHEQIAEVEELIELDVAEDWDHLEEQSKANKESKINAFLQQVEQQLLERIDDSITQARQSILTSALGIQNKAESTIQQKVEQSSNEFASLFEQWKQATEIKINKHTIDVLKKACKHLEDQFEIVVQEQEESTFTHLSEKIFAASIEAKDALLNDLRNKVQELSASLQNTIKDADGSLKLHVEQQLKQFNDNIVAESIKNFDDGIAAFFNKQTLWLQEASTNQIKQISESAATRIDAACKTIDGAIENLQSKHGDLTKQLKEHAQQTLEQAAEMITTEQIRSVRECVDEVLAEQMQALEAKASDESIISEARAAQANVFKNALGTIKTEMSNEVKSHVANLQSDLYKKFAVYSQSYAGGGTVAVQYADGGTMNGTLNVASGQILSGGIDLYNIFSTSTSGGTQTLSFNESDSSLTIVPNGNTVSLSSLGGGSFGDYLPLTGGIINGNVTIFGTLSTTLLEATSANITYIDIKQYELSGFDVTGDVNIIGNTSISGYVSADSIKFNIEAPPTTQLGEIYWDAADNTLAIDMGNGVTQQVGFEQYIEIKANGSNIDNGTVVWATDAVSTGNSGIIRGTNKLANGTTPARFLIGVATEDILSEENGRVTTFGVVREVDLRDYGSPSETWSVGDILYPSPTIVGGWTNVEPMAPNLAMPIAFILFINNGSTKSNVTMMVRVDSGYNLGEIHDVSISNPQNGQSLLYDALSGIWVNGDTYQGTDLKSLTANWENTYTTVQANSATTWNYQGTDIKALTANWQSTYSTVQANSSNWENTWTVFSSQSSNNVSVYTTVNSNSGNWNYQGTDIKSLTANWQSTYSTVQTNSATTWNYQGTDIKSLTANWENTYTSFNAQSADNASVYTTVNSNSGNWNYQGTDIKALTAVWQSTYTSFNAQSANNASVYTTVNSNSATWGAGGSGIDTGVRALTANWQSTYTTVQSNSSTWGAGGSPQTLSFNESNAELSIAFGNTVSLSSLSGGGTGGSGVNIAGNIAYNRWQFTGSPPVSTFNITGATSDVEESYRVTIDAVIQDPANYTVAADVITFSQAPLLSSNIVIIETYVVPDETPLVVQQYQRWYHTGNNAVSSYDIAGAILTDRFAYRVTIDYLLQDPLSYTIDVNQSKIIFSESPPLSSEIVIVEQYHTALTATVSSFTTPVTASGDFLIVRINSVDRAIRLWDF